MHRYTLHHRLIVLTLGLAALLGGCGGGDALPPGATPLTPAPDTTAPTLSIVSGAAGATATGNVTFSFSFSENVGSTFSADDVVVAGGSKGAFAMPNGTSATLVVTPNAGAAGSLDVSVAAGRYSDAAGNLNTAAAAASQAFNTVAGALGTGSTGSCTAAPCVDFGAAGLAMVPFGGLAAEVLADPGDAANKVIKLVKVPAAEVWAGATVDPSGTGVAKVTAFDFATSKTVTLRFLSPAVGQTIMLKVENAADSLVFMEAQATTTQANQWETLSFNFTTPSNGSWDASKAYDRVSVFPHYGTKVTADSTYYADELKYTAAAAGGGGAGVGGGACGSSEPTCAPTGSVPADAVVIYSDAAQVANFNPKPDWGQAPAVTYSQVTIAGNSSLKYGFTAPALYEGLGWEANPVNVSAKGKLHIDFWSADVGSVKVSIISSGGRENAVTQTLTAGSWNSVDIDLAQYTVPDKAAIIQIKLEPNVGGTLYVDNIYFWGAAPVAGPPVVFSSGFGGSSATVEGGAFGGYSGSSLDGFNCNGQPSSCGSGGSFTPAVAAAASSFFYYYQTPSPVTELFAGIFVQAPGLTTGLSATADTPGISIAGKTTMKFNLGQNPEWFAAPNKNVGVILTLGKFYDVNPSTPIQNCNIKLLAVVTPTAAASTAYAVPMSAFQVIQNCNVAGLGTTAALALSPLSQVDFQAVGSGNPLPTVGGKLVGANMSVGVGSPAVYPSTLALSGAITFE